MKRSAKIALGVASLWPLVWFVLFFLLMFAMMFWMSSSPTTPNGMPLPFVALMAGHAFSMLFMVALIAFYIVFLFRTDRVPQDKKALWAVVLFLGNALAIPVFWYFYIWRQPQQTSEPRHTGVPQPAAERPSVRAHAEPLGSKTP